LAGRKTLKSATFNFDDMEESTMHSKRKFTTRDLVYVSIFAAMCTIGTFIKIPFGVGAMVHLGTGVMFTIAIIYGGVYAGLAGALGSALFDLVMGFSFYTLWSFFIKGIAGLIAGLLAKGLWPEATAKPAPNKTWLFRAFGGCLLAALWTLSGYVLAWWQVTGSLATAVSNIPSSLMTSVAGIIVALVLAAKLRTRL
jgi:uncharacterized membrane protein